MSKEKITKEQMYRQFKIERERFNPIRAIEEVRLWIEIYEMGLVSW